MQTVFLIRNVAPEMYGGAEIYQLKIAAQLEKHGFCPIIVTNSTRLIEESERLGIKVLIPPYLRNQNWSGWRNLLLPGYFVFQRKLMRWYRKKFDEYKPSVINVQSRDDMIAATMVATESDVRVLWTDHADFLNWTLWNVNVRLKNAIGKKIIKLSAVVDKVVFVSQNLRRQTEKMIAPKKLCNTIVIENGVEDVAKLYRDRHAKKHSFIYLGRVTREKGILELTEAFRKVVDAYPDAQLNIYGEGDMDAISGDNIKMRGMADDPIGALAENEVFVLPSYKEGLSTALIEAAMMKKRIIASDVGGNSEVVKTGETGLLVPAQNVEELTAAMVWMLENETKASEMAENARRGYEEKFDLDKIFAEKMLSLYNIGKER